MDIVDGSVYALGLDESDWGLDGLEDVFGEIGRDVLFQLDFADDEPRITLAWSKVQSTEQDLCQETRSGSISAFDNPWFVGGALMSYWDGPGSWLGMEVRGAFGPDPDTLHGVEFYLLDGCDEAFDECVQCVPPIATSPDTCDPPDFPLSIPVDRQSTPLVPRTWSQIVLDPDCGG